MGGGVKGTVCTSAFYAGPGAKSGRAACGWGFMGLFWRSYRLVLGFIGLRVFLRFFTAVGVRFRGQNVV